VTLPKRNYGFEKRQKELKREQKQEAKRQRRLERTETPPEDANVAGDQLELPPEE
jgi:hypothetical protein